MVGEGESEEQGDKVKINPLPASPEFRGGEKFPFLSKCICIIPPP
jgi:hypothetical protein